MSIRNLKDLIPTGPRFEREFSGDESWKRFKESYGAQEYYSGPGRVYPFGLKVRFTLPKNFAMAELIHHSGEQVRGNGKGQRCTRCGLMLVLWPETAFAPGHDIYVDTRNPDSQFGFAMADITDPEACSLSEYILMSKLPKCSNTSIDKTTLGC